MALSYDNWKQTYSGLNEEQRKQYNDKIQSQGGDVVKMSNEFVNRFNQENSSTQSDNSSNFTNGNGNNGQNQNLNNGYSSQNFDPNETLDTNKFGATDGKVVVKEGTAQQTGKPDYELNSDARMQEITNNLNAYWQNNREFFKDRATFNQMFSYNSRSNEQKALLDSYWKKKEDESNIAKYTNADSVANGMKNAEITTDQMDLLRANNPELYAQWQKKQQDDIDLRIANFTTPADPTDNAELFNSLIKKLNLEPGDPYQIYDNWYNMAERLGVFKDSEELKSYQAQLNENHSKMEAIMGRYASSVGGTVSDALAAARMQKALAPYQQREVDLQNSYTTLLNGRNSNLAIANQSAQALAMQAQEDQRIFSQRLQGLGFAMSTAEFRTYEQKAQTDLYKFQIQNEMDLLRQSKANDLSLYNQYATAKLNNQLNSELTDLSVTDPVQQRANLNNVLSQYYAQWGDIIQRPQSQVVDDVLAYAQKNGISVAEALRENFVKPLQNKAEYKTRVAQSYGLDKYQQQYSYSIDENGNVKITASGYGELPESVFKNRDSRKEAYGDVYEYSNTWADYIQNLAGAIKDGSFGGQCGAFVNDVLIAGGDKGVFGDTLSSKIKACNVKKEEGPQVGYAVVFDLGFTSSDGENHGHVGIVANVNGDGSIDVLESNGKSDKTIHLKRYSKNLVDSMVKGYYKPSNYDIQKEYSSNDYYTESSENPYGGTSKTTKTGVEVNSGGWISDLENEYIKEKWDNKDVMNQTLSSYGITIQEYNAQKKKYLDYQAKVVLIEEAQKMYNAVEDLLTWNQEKSSSGRGSRHSWRIDVATYNSINGGDGNNGVSWFYDKETANGINKYNFLKNNQLLEKYQQLKKAGASFGAMQKSEWDLVGSASSKLNWLSTDAEFEGILTDMKNHYAKILADAGVVGYYNTDI